MRRLVVLYPRRWRDRYGAELGALIEHQRPTAALMIDVVRGALDARLHEAEILGDSPEHRLRGSAAALVQVMALDGLVLAALTKASEDTAMATPGPGPALGAAWTGAALALAGALALGAPAAARPRVALRMALPLVAFVLAGVGLGALAPSLGHAAGVATFWAWALTGAGAVGAAARVGARAVRRGASPGLLAASWSGAWLTAGGTLLTLAGVTAWSLWALTGSSGASLGGLPPGLVAPACALAAVVAAGAAWRCVCAGNRARRALATR